MVETQFLTVSELFMITIFDGEFSMKRTCNGCVAMDPAWGSCDLFYKTKVVQINGREIKAPDEDCPKPLTIKSYTKLMQSP